MRQRDIFKQLNLPERPVVLAPLAGVSDIPFRMMCQEQGADLTYVEMLSATALCFDSKRTFAMLDRAAEELRVGVQLTGREPEETARAVGILEPYSFETVDLNMGCPVKKVVKTGCGSAILQDPDKVFRTVKLCKEATSKPLTVKIRIGWTHEQLTGLEVAKAAEEAGASWVTVHGRTRADDYSVPVNLGTIAEIKRAVSIPVLGNGNIFSREDAEGMYRQSAVDGVMVSRGALGNPWVFDEIKGNRDGVLLEEWRDLVVRHLYLQQHIYGDAKSGAVCMRKHILWYAKGWAGAKDLRNRINEAETLLDCLALVEQFAEEKAKTGEWLREPLVDPQHESRRFAWDPKWDMDRKLDRGVGTDRLETEQGPVANFETSQAELRH